MITNLYYYSFYELVLFSKKVNKRNTEYAFSAMAYLTLLMCSNIITLLSFLLILGKVNYNKKTTYILLALLFMTINYYFLIHDGKSKRIIEQYEKAAKSQWFSVLFWLYAIVSVILCAYASYLVKTNSHNVLSVMI